MADVYRFGQHVVPPETPELPEGEGVVLSEEQAGALEAQLSSPPPAPVVAPAAPPPTPTTELPVTGVQMAGSAIPGGMGLPMALPAFGVKQPGAKLTDAGWIKDEPPLSVIPGVTNEQARSTGGRVPELRTDRGGGVEPEAPKSTMDKLLEPFQWAMEPTAAPIDEWDRWTRVVPTSAAKTAGQLVRFFAYDGIKPFTDAAVNYAYDSWKAGGSSEEFGDATVGFMRSLGEGVYHTLQGFADFNGIPLGLNALLGEAAKGAGVGEVPETMTKEAFYDVWNTNPVGALLGVLPIVGGLLRLKAPVKNKLAARSQAKQLLRDAEEIRRAANRAERVEEKIRIAVDLTSAKYSDPKVARAVKARDAAHGKEGAPPAPVKSVTEWNAEQAAKLQEGIKRAAASEAAKARAKKEGGRKEEVNTGEVATLQAKYDAARERLQRGLEEQRASVEGTREVLRGTENRPEDRVGTRLAEAARRARERAAAQEAPATEPAPAPEAAPAPTPAPVAPPKKIPWFKRVGSWNPLEGQSFDSPVELSRALDRVLATSDAAAGIKTRAAPVRGADGRWQLVDMQDSGAIAKAWGEALPIRLDSRLKEFDIAAADRAEGKQTLRDTRAEEALLDAHAKGSEARLEEIAAEEAKVDFGALEREAAGEVATPTPEPTPKPAVDPTAALSEAVKRAAQAKNGAQRAEAVEALREALAAAEGIEGVGRLKTQARGAMKALEAKGVELRSGIDPTKLLGLFSHAYRTVTESMKGPMGREQFVAFLRNKGVKQEEIEWTYGELPERVTPEWAKQRAEEKTPRLTRKVLESGNEESAPQYFDMALPGGEGYREVLVGLDKERQYSAQTQLQQYHYELDQRYGRDIRASATAEEIAKLERLADEAAAERASGKKDVELETYTGGHYGGQQDNNFGWRREAAYTDAQGKRGLMQYEVQGDWGRKQVQHGVITETAPSWVVKEPSGNVIDSFDNLETAERAYAAEIRERGWRVEQGAELPRVDAVPRNPFVAAREGKWVDETQSFLLRDAIVSAAKEGYDRIYLPGTAEQVGMIEWMRAGGVEWREPGRPIEWIKAQPGQVGWTELAQFGDKAYTIREAKNYPGMVELRKTIEVNGRPVTNSEGFFLSATDAKNAVAAMHEGKVEKGGWYVKGTDTNVTGIINTYLRDLPKEGKKLVKPFGGEVGRTKLPGVEGEVTYIDVNPAIKSEGLRLFSGLDPTEVARTFSALLDRYRNMYSPTRAQRVNALRKAGQQLKAGVVGHRGITDKMLEDTYEFAGYQTANLHRVEQRYQAIARVKTSQMQERVREGLPRGEWGAMDRVAEAMSVLGIEERAPGKYEHPMPVEDARALVDSAPSHIRERATRLHEELREQGIERLHEAGLIKSEVYERYQDAPYIRREGLEDYIDPQEGREPGISGGPKFDSSIDKLQKGKKGEALAPLWTRIYDQQLRVEARIKRNEARKQLATLAVDAEGASVRPAEYTQRGRVKKPKPHEPYELMHYYEKGEKKHFLVHKELAKGWEAVDNPLEGTLARVAGTLAGSTVMKTATVGTNPLIALGLFPVDLWHSWAAMSVWGKEGKQALYRSDLKFLGALVRDMPEALGDAFTRKGKYLEALDDGLMDVFLAGHGDPFRSIAGREYSALFDKGLGRFNVALEAAQRLWNREQVLRFIAEREGKTLEEVRADPMFRAEAAGRVISKINYGEGGSITRGAEVVLPFTKAAVAATRGLVEAYKADPTTARLKMAKFAALSAMVYLYNRENAPEQIAGVDPRTRVNTLYAIMPTGERDENGEWRHDVLKLKLDPAQRWINALVQWSIAATLNDPVKDAGGLTWKDVGRAMQELAGPLGTSPAPVFHALAALGNVDLRNMEELWRGGKLNPGSEMWDKNTPQWAKDFGGDLLSPKQLEAIANAYGLGSNPFFQATMGGWVYLRSGKMEALEDLTTRKAVKAMLSPYYGQTSPYKQHERPMEEARATARGENYVLRRDFDEVVADYRRKVKRGERTDGEWERIQRLVNAQPYEQQMELWDRFEIAVSAVDAKHGSFWKQLKAIPDAREQGREYARAMARLTKESQGEYWGELERFYPSLSKEWEEGYYEEYLRLKKAGRVGGARD